MCGRCQTDYHPSPALRDIRQLSGYTVALLAFPQAGDIPRKFTNVGDMSAHRDPLATDQRLDSWKEIAAFFARDERTVRRWEKERGLPVHRVPGSARGGVFAYTAEIQQWLAGTEDLDWKPTEQPSDRCRVADTARAIEPGQARPALLARGMHSWSWQRICLWMIPLLATLGMSVFLGLSHRQMKYKPALAAPHVPNPEARDLYLKGRYYWNRRTPDDLRQGVDYFTQAIVKDPNYAQAYSGLADCYNLLREFSAMPSHEAFPRALAAAQRAVQLDDTSAEAHTSLALATYAWLWNPTTAEREFQRALVLDPKFVRAHHWYATFLAAMKRFPEAMEQIEQARTLDPSSATVLADKAFILLSGGQRTEALALLQQLEKTDPKLASTHRYLSDTYFESGDYARAFSERRRFAELRGDIAGLEVEQAAERGFAAGGIRGMWEAELPIQRSEYAKGKEAAINVAMTCGRLNRQDEALRYLQYAFDNRDEGMLYVRSEPAFSALHGKPSYEQLVSKVKSQPN